MATLRQVGRNELAWQRFSVGGVERVLDVPEDSPAEGNGRPAHGRGEGRGSRLAQVRSNAHVRRSPSRWLSITHFLLNT